MAGYRHRCFARYRKASSPLVIFLQWFLAFAQSRIPAVAIELGLGSRWLAGRVEQIGVELWTKASRKMYSRGLPSGCTFRLPVTF